MQRLEVRGAVRPVYGSLGVKGLKDSVIAPLNQVFCSRWTHFHSPCPATSTREWVQRRTYVYEHKLCTQDFNISTGSKVKDKNIYVVPVGSKMGGGSWGIAPRIPKLRILVYAFLYGFILWNKIIYEPSFTTQIFIVTRRLMQHVSALIWAIIR
jgi:hypothetical protein